MGLSKNSKFTSDGANSNGSQLSVLMIVRNPNFNPERVGSLSTHQSSQILDSDRNEGPCQHSNVLITLAQLQVCPAQIKHSEPINALTGNDPPQSPFPFLYEIWELIFSYTV